MINLDHRIFFKDYPIRMVMGTSPKETLVCAVDFLRSIDADELNRKTPFYRDLQDKDPLTCRLIEGLTFITLDSLQHVQNKSLQNGISDFYQHPTVFKILQRGSNMENKEGPTQFVGELKELCSEKDCMIYTETERILIENDELKAEVKALKIEKEQENILANNSTSELLLHRAKLAEADKMIAALERKVKELEMREGCIVKSSSNNEFETIVNAVEKYGLELTIKKARS